MSYYINRILNTSFEQTIEDVVQALQKEGFGVLTEIDVQATLKKKLDLDMKPYRILGACNPPYAHRALEAEPLIGTMLPCNVVVRELETGEVEVAAVDPLASMQAVENPALVDIATEIRGKLARVVDSL
ncbi:MAG: DUF302 domain-containing protein [Candidatus Neomarinimicrobiota bacterium]|nr:MAG: DUF302 domain-containing protein [Candidatus Neomarinimicrobiota bacterium]